MAKKPASRKPAGKTPSAKEALDAGALFERVPWSSASARVRVAGNSEQPDDVVLVHRGDLHLRQNLELDYGAGILKADRAAGILVEGSLTIDGCLANLEDDYGPFVQVTGDLVAHGVATGGSRIRVDGNLTARAVIGVYNHGCIDVGGDLTAAVVATEHTVKAAGKVNGLRYDGWGQSAYMIRDGVRDEADPYEVKGVFPAALIKGESADLGKARRFCVDGRPVLRDEPASVRQTLRKSLGKKLEAPEKVKSLSITNKDLTILPAELLRFPNLEKLDLTHNRLRTLPDELGELGHLRELRLRGNGLQRLPDSIGECRELTVLDLEANCLVGLPDSLARCENLRVVNLRNNPYSYVRRSFGRWDRVELMEELPAVLTRLPRLEQLVIDDTMIRRLPSTPFASASLGEVTYEDTLLTEVDSSLHPQIARPSLARTRRWAVAHIGFWFDHEHVRDEFFFDPRARSYDFTEMRALLRVVLRTLVPAAAPYDEAIAAFNEESAEIVRRLCWDEERGLEHSRALFHDLRDYLDELAPELGAQVLVEGVRAVFAGRAGMQA